MRTRIAACSPKDAVAVPSLAATAACLATWADGLLFGDDGIAGLRFRHTRGCLPRFPRPPRSPRQSRLRSRTLLGPVAPRELSEGLAKPPSAVCWMALRTGLVAAWRIRRFAPVRLRCGDMARPCRRGASPHANPRYLASRVAWHLGVVSRKLRLSRPCRIPAGCPGLPGLVGMAPDRPPHGGP